MRPPPTRHTMNDTPTTTPTPTHPHRSLAIVPDGRGSYAVALDDRVLLSGLDLFGAQWVQADYERCGIAAIWSARLVQAECERRGDAAVWSAR